MRKELGLVLYYCEGGKDKCGKIEVTSTDPLLLQTFANWLRTNYPVKEEKLKAMLWLREDENELEHKMFWSNSLNIPLEQFRKSYRTPNRGKKAPHGVCRLYYCDKRLLKEILSEAEKLLITSKQP